MAERMTIEKLAQMTQGEFVALRGKLKERFESIDGRFGQVDGRFDRLERKMEQHFFALFDRMDAGFATSNAYFEEINKSLDMIKFNIFIDRGWPSADEVEIS